MSPARALLAAPWTGLPVWAAAHALLAAAFLWPAMDSGFPIVFFDTGGYLERGTLGEIPAGRSVVYGGFLAFLKWGPLGFWPAIAAQSLATAWVVGLALRARGITDARWLLALGIALALATGLPWYTAQMMPDWLAGVAALAAWLLTACRAETGRVEKGALIVLVAFAVASHLAFAIMLIGLAFVAIALYGVRRPLLLVLALGLGGAAIPAGNWLAAGQLSPPPAGATFLLGRLIQDGLAKEYLDVACPDPSLKLCAVKDELPKTANDFMWGLETEKGSAASLGGVVAANPEAERIVLGSLRHDPVGNAVAAVRAMIDQLGLFATGDGIERWYWHTRWRIAEQFPDQLAAYDSARQIREGYDFTKANRVHVPVGTLSLVLLVGLGLWRMARGIGPDARLLVFVGAALVGNALICGALANPHDRYMSRMVWIATFAVALVVLGRWRKAHSETA